MISRRYSQIEPADGRREKRVLLFKILLKVKNHLSDLFRNYFGTLYLQIERCYAPEIDMPMKLVR